MAKYKQKQKSEVNMTNKKLKHLQNHLYGIKSTIEELKIISKNKNNISIEREKVLIYNLLLNLKHSLKISNELYSSLLFLFFRVTKCKNNIAQDFRVGVRSNIIYSIDTINSYRAFNIKTMLLLLESNIKSIEKTLEKFI